MIKFLKTWALPISMISGALCYFIYVSIPALAPYKSTTLEIVSFVQPLLIFAMLFLAFCKVDPTKMRFCKWHAWHILIQTLFFVALAAVTIYLRSFVPSVGITDTIIILEGTMLCFVCPTATAAAVITNKLGGDMEGLTTYLILINMTVAILVPTFMPLIYPQGGLDFWQAFWMIMGRVFPMLICPFLASIVVRYVFPLLHTAILRTRDLVFYIWCVSLAGAIAVSIKSLMHSNGSFIIIIGIALGSLVACVLQFYLGRLIGLRYDCQISAGQALGQKNTVFAIWAGYTFLDPVSSIAGGFYSIWHNVWNSWQLYRAEKLSNTK